MEIQSQSFEPFGTCFACGKRFNRGLVQWKECCPECSKCPQCSSGFLIYYKELDNPNTEQRCMSCLHYYIIKKGE